MESVLGYLGTELDCRFSSIRTKETNSGNLICDIVRNAVNADVALINSGTIRTDDVVPVGMYFLG